MLSKNLESAINEQLNFEIYSAHIYLAMSAYCSDLGLSGFENWFQIQYQEELAHAKKFMKFINEKGGRVRIKGFEDPQNDYESLLDVFETSLRHEQEVTKRIYNLMDIAIDEREHATKSFLQWFIDEQVEEEDSFTDLINKINLVKDAGLYLLDQELATRVFVDPNAQN